MREPARNLLNQRTWLQILAVLGIMLALFAMWRWTPMKDWLELEILLAWKEDLNNSLMGPLIVMLLVFPIGSIISFPISLLILASVYIFGPLLGFVYSIVGLVLGSSITFGIGHQLGFKVIQTFKNPRVKRLNQRLQAHGVMAVAVVCCLPLPLTVINLAIGASQIHFRDFVLGTALAMGPWTLALALFADSAYRVLHDPQPTNILWLVLTIVIAGAIILGLWHFLRQRREAEKSS